MNKITTAVVIRISLVGAANAVSIYAPGVRHRNVCVRVYAVRSLPSTKPGLFKGDQPTCVRNSR